MTPACRSCGCPDPAQLLEVTDVRTGWVSYVCRPGLTQACWRSIGPRDVERIALAAPPNAAERAAFAAAAERLAADTVDYRGDAHRYRGRPSEEVRR